MSEPTIEELKANYGYHLGAGNTTHYRSFVGIASHWDREARFHFNLLTELGLKEAHYYLDLGCGALKSGRLMMMYLFPDRYYGIEPEEWLVKEGIKKEIGQDLIDIKRPKFIYSRNFPLSEFEIKFDYILAASIFTHADKSQIRKCFQELKLSTHENSIFLATFQSGNADYERDGWVYPACISYKPETMTSLAAESGFAAKFIDRPAAVMQEWILFGSPEKIKSLEVFH